MSNYAILRTKKLANFAKIGAACAHNSRTMPVPNADPERSKHNQRPVGSGDLVADVRERIEQTGAKLAKNSPPAFELILTASPEAMRRLSSQRSLARWARANLDFLKAEFGDNLVAMDIHVDEKTPHIHAIVCPVVKKFDKRCKKEVSRVTAKHYLGGREKLQGLQDRYAERMQAFDLERGKKRSKAKHNDVKAWYSGLSELVGKVRSVFAQNDELKSALNSEREARQTAESQLKKLTLATQKKQQAQRSNPFKNTLQSQDYTPQ